MEINSAKIQLSNLDRELWPGEEITKHDLIRYYLEAAPYLLPHLKNRFLVLRRFPEGIEKPGFYQKNCPSDAPRWIERFSYEHPKEEKSTSYILAHGPETLAWLGNQACIEIHPWLSTYLEPESPDYAVFDLDPMEGIEYKQLCETALTFRELLEKEGLRCYPKTSGSRGLQLYLPLKPGHGYDNSRAFAKAFSEKVQMLMPAITTTERKVSERGKKIYLDYLQNARGKTLVAAYSPRALPGAPVSAPLEWEEVESFCPHPSSFTIKTIVKRLHDRGDIFAPLLQDDHQVDLKNK